MNDRSRALIRISAFLRKEIFEVLRQPLLILTLVLGPFLILLFFGIGYRSEARALRTLFVVEPGSPLAAKIEEYATTLGGQLLFAGITDDLDAARARLQRGEVDLVVVVPADVLTRLQNNQQAVFTLYHHEIDPFQTNYINIFGRVYVEEINRRILRLITTLGQTDAAGARQKLAEARAAAAALQDLLQECADAVSQAGQPPQCDREHILDAVQNLDRRVDELNRTMGSNTSLMQSVQSELGGEPAGRDSTTTLNDLIDKTNRLSDFENRADSYLTNLKLLADLQTDLRHMEETLSQFLQIEPGILISPFRSEAQSIAAIVPDAAQYYAPAVIALLLQHLAVTFAALSMVREEALGAMELFFVSPLSALETLTGKYLSYLLFGSGVALILLLLVVWGMGVPVLGSWPAVGLVILTLLFASLGIGFVISLLSQTDIQAVQYSMIILLTSVFFSGFLLGLETLIKPVRVISWMLPATYGTLLLRDIMLRGDPPAFNALFGLLAMGTALFGAGWALLHRSMTT
ncbi:MAG: ABC transporter permease [Caldilineae bacterium]|nr:MAG: ABC transporter permease [Caldilineae bacterium]